MLPGGFAIRAATQHKFWLGFIAGGLIFGTLILVGIEVRHQVLENAQGFPDSLYETVNPFNRPPEDVDALIEIHTPEDLTAKRNRLIELIWGEAELPTDIPTDIVDLSQADPEAAANYSDLTNVKQIEQITIHMEFGFESIVYFFQPNEGSNNRLIVYHEGHEPDLAHDKRVFQAMLNAGFAVMSFSMPLVGRNPGPDAIELPHVGRLPRFLEHGNFAFLEPFVHGSTVKLFIEPVIIGLNYADSLGYESYGMLGLSGGGWSTVVVSAVDTRIRQSFPVSGSVPEFQRVDDIGSYGLDMGDYEQWLPGIYPEIDYLEMYMLGSADEGREQLDVAIQYDPCCFGGLRFMQWSDVLVDRVNSLGLGGTFNVYLDTKNQIHSISSETLDVIMQHLEHQPAP